MDEPAYDIIQNEAGCVFGAQMSNHLCHQVDQIHQGFRVNREHHHHPERSHQN